MLYRALRKTLDSKPVLIPDTEDVKRYITDSSLDWYESLYFYNDEHKKRYEEKGTLAGIRDTTTNQLYFDFDSSEDIDSTFYDAAELISRLQELNVRDINVYFTGNKGCAVKVVLDQYINSVTFKETVYKLAADLKTFDKVVNDPNRVIRIVNTKHAKSGLYKVPLTLEQLETLSKEEILQLAKGPIDEPTQEANNFTLFQKASFNQIVSTPEPKQSVNHMAGKDISLDWSVKPKNLTNCRWAMQNGYFDNGNRNNVFLTLASTYKNQGFDLEITYRLLKGVATIQGQRYNTERYSEKELYNNIILQVYSEWWNGGQGTCREPGWMQDYCNTLGDHSCKSQHSQEYSVVKLAGVFDTFDSYVNNFEKNVLTTGINDLDAKVKFLVGTSNALLGSPGIGKSSWALQLLNHNSKKNINCLFFSYDMFSGAVITRMIQRHFGAKYGTDIQEIYKNYTERADVRNAVKEILTTEYANVGFCFRSGQTIDELEDTIRKAQEDCDNNLKLVIVDYNELVVSEFSDPTAASAQVAQRLRQIANDRQVCIITLLQPAKMYSTPADEIKTYNAAKGSSAIAQSVTLMLGISRPGFDPMNPVNDKYLNITCLKNRNGGLFSIDLGWNGLTGKIRKLDDREVFELKELREHKKDMENSSGGW